MIFVIKKKKKECKQMTIFWSRLQSCSRNECIQPKWRNPILSLSVLKYWKLKRFHEKGMYWEREFLAIEWHDKKTVSWSNQSPKACVHFFFRSLIDLHLIMLSIEDSFRSPFTFHFLRKLFLSEQCRAKELC